MLKQTLTQLIKLCLFKAKPQDLGYSMMVFYTFIVANLIILTYSMSNQADLLIGFGLAIIFVGVLIGYTFLLLKAFKLRERFIQTMNAILGANAVMMILALVLGVILYYLMDSNIAVSFTIIFARIVMLTLFVWTLAIMIYIYKHALERNWLVAGVSAIFMLVAANLATVIILQLLTQNMPIVN